MAHAPKDGTRHPHTQRSRVQVLSPQVQHDDADLAEFLRTALPTGSPDPSKISFDTFALWLERTRRYS